MADSNGLSSALRLGLFAVVILGASVLFERLHHDHAVERADREHGHERARRWLEQAGRARTARDYRTLARLLEASPPGDDEAGDEWRTLAQVFHREAQSFANAASSQIERDMALDAVAGFDRILGELPERTGDVDADPWSLPTWEAQQWQALDVRSTDPQGCVEFPLGEGSIELRGHYWIEADVPRRRDRRAGDTGIVIKLESADGPSSFVAKREGEHLKLRGTRACLQLLDNSPGDNAQADPPLEYRYWLKVPEPTDD